MTEEPTPLTDEKMAAQELDPYERGILDRALDRIEEGLNDEDESAVRRFKKALEQDIVETRRTAVDPRDPKSGVKATANLLYITRQDGPTVMRVIDYADERISSLLATIDAERVKVAELTAELDDCHAMIRRLEARSAALVERLQSAYDYPHDDVNALRAIIKVALARYKESGDQSQEG